MTTVKIIGAGGYGGVGLTELIHGHPQAEIQALVDLEDTGSPIAQLYPHLDGIVDHFILDPASPGAQEPADVVFMATPDGVGMKLASEELTKGAKVIDFSGDFRFNSESAYADYAGRLGRDQTHAVADLLPETVYGLPELHRDAILPETRLVGNPGCFAVSVILGLSPAVKAGIVETAGIIADCKTGVSGAGKKAHPVFHYPARYENTNAYKLAGHQHICEIERELTQLAGSDIRITFTAQVVPMCRGILSTLYGRLSKKTTEKDVIEAYRDFYALSPFVRIYGSTHLGGTIQVRGTNYCNLIVSVDARTNTLRVVSHIDNLMKGQAGSAVQNMNLLCGLPETMGLDMPARYP